MKNITVDENKCIHCGLCIKDCVGKCLEFDENKIPFMAKEKNCISCQHCLAICPEGALSFCGKNPENSEAVDFNSILGLIKARKSIRQFTNDEISEENFNKLKAMLPYIPTGCNSHALHFSFVEKKSAMDVIRNTVNQKIINLLNSKVLSPVAKGFAGYKKSFLNGEDVIFRNAPNMVVVSSPLNAPCAKEDGIIALSYLELYAQSLGLGTCWCGFGAICMKFFPELSEMFEIPSGYVPVYTMLMGNPAVKYSRTTQPEEFQISAIKEVKPKDSCIFCKIKRFFTNFLR